jgi:hypothetical protein
LRALLIKLANTTDVVLSGGMICVRNYSSDFDTIRYWNLHEHLRSESDFDSGPM